MTNDDFMNNQTTRAFGVGCFNFRLKQRAPFRLKVSDYADKLGSALSRLTNLSDLDITYGASAENKEFHIEDEIPPFADGGLFPFLPFGQICFTLYIPRRIQEELVGSTRTQTEVFRISIYSEYYGPVSYVECIDAKPGCSPSSAVQIVREYLSREFSKFEDIDFEALGPSPFHVDFYLSENFEKPNFKAVETPDIGYNKINIYTNQPISSPDTIHELYKTIGDELDLYYHLTRMRSIQIDNWLELEAQWAALRNSVNTPLRFWKISQKFEIHKQARDLLSSAYTFSAASSITKQNSTECVRSSYEKDIKSYFKTRCEALLTEAFPDYPVQSIISWATHIHDSSFKLAEIVTVLLSGLLGGLIGALVTALLAVGK